MRLTVRRQCKYGNEEAEATTNRNNKIFILCIRFNFPVMNDTVQRVPAHFFGCYK